MILARYLHNFGVIFVGSWRDLNMILARSRHDLGGILALYLAKMILLKSSRDLGKILAGSCKDLG